MRCSARLTAAVARTRTKQFKRVTLGCFAVTLAALGFLGIADGYDLNLPQWAVVGGLLTLGAAAGPVQVYMAERKGGGLGAAREGREGGRESFCARVACV